MGTRTVQLVLHYDGTRFAGWQRQPRERTVQGVIEECLERLCAGAVPVLGAGRTDAGVHALGQAAGVKVPDRWTPAELRRALNAVLPDDIWVESAFGMRDDFHARYSALSRTYRYLLGTDEAVESPFRRGRELAWHRPLDRALLDAAAATIVGAHSFRAFAVRGTAPEEDDHRCTVRDASWGDREGGLAFTITANRFLHHMVRFLVGTFLDVGTGKRELSTVARLLGAADNRDVSTPSPGYALYLQHVEYAPELYLANS